MKIAYNPTGKPIVNEDQLSLLKNDIIFDLSGMAVYARGILVGKVYKPFEKSTSSTEGYNGLVPFPDYNGNLKTRFLREDGTWVVPTDTTYSIVNSTTDGLAPKIGTSASATITTQADEWVLTSTKGATPTWRKLPGNAFSNTNNYRPISVNGTSILGNNNTALNLVAGTNITLSPKKDSNNKYTGEVTITASNPAWDNITGKPTTLSGYGITDAVTLNTAQTISGEKTFSNLKVSNTNLVTNLNAEMVDGLHKDEFQQAVYTYFPTTHSIANTTTLANIISPNLTSDSDSFKFYDTKFYGTASSTSNRAQIAYGYAYDNIHFRRYYNGAWNTWKQLAFTSDIPAVYFKRITSGFKDEFRTQTKGDDSTGDYIAAIRCNNASVEYAPQDSSGIAFGAGDTHGYLYTSYSSALAYIGGGNANKLNWIKQIAFRETTLAGYGITDAVKIVNGSADVSESCVGYTTSGHNNLTNGGLFTGLGADGNYGSQLLGNYVGTGLYYRGKNNGTWTAWKTVAFTDSNVASADKVDGYDSSVLFTCESGYGLDVNAPHRNKESGTLLYKISSNCTNIPPSCTDGVLVHFNSQGTDTAFQLVSNYSNTRLYYRSGNLYESSQYYLYNKAWKQLAFTDQLGNYLPLTGGTLTGALTINGVLITNKVASKSLVSFIGNDNTERIALQNNSSNDLLVGGGYTDKTVYLDANIFRNRANTTVFGGNVGIGTDSPLYKLHVAGTTSTNLLFIGGSSHPMIIGNGSLLSLGAANNNSKASVVLDLNTDSFRRNSASTTISLGTAAYPWTNIYGGTADISGNVTASKFVTSGGTSSQFVKGDGSLDSNTYLTSLPSHNHSLLSDWADTRAAATTPNDYNSSFKVVGIKSAGTTLGLTSAQTGNYVTIIGWRGWGDKSGGYSWEIASTDKNRLYVRSGDSTTWNNGWQAIAYLNDIPTSLKNPNALTLSAGTFAAKTYDGSAAVTVNVPTKTSHLTNDSGFITIDHTHSYASKVTVGSTAYSVSSNNITIPAYPTSLKCPSSLTIQTNGTSQGAWDGSSAKTINITYSNVGAAAASHTHSYLPLSGGTMTGNIKVYTDEDGRGLKFGTSTLNSLNNQLLWQSAEAIRFGSSSWDWNAWAGLKYNHSSKIIYLGLADGTIFNANSAQSGGKLYTPGISNIYIGNGSYTVLHSNNWSTYCAAKSHTHDYAASSHTHTTIVGSYTANGGKQNPNYFGKNKVGFLMMNTTVNNNSNCKDWIIMDCYGGSDVGGAVAFGVNRQSLGAYIMRSASERTSWTESAELLGTHNYNNYALSLSGGTLSGDLTLLNLYVNYMITSSKPSGALYNPWSIHMDNYLWIQSATADGTNVKGKIALSGKGAESLTELFLKADLTKIHNTILFNKLSAPTTSGGSTYGPGANGQVLKSNGSTVYWANDNNSYGYIGTTAVQSSSKAQSLTGIIDITASGNIIASGEITAYSDRRLKSNIKPLENRGYIQPMTYIKDNKECIGFIAQDVLEKYPELVNDNNEYLSLNYLQYVAVLQALIIELEKRIKELENGTRKL